MLISCAASGVAETMRAATETATVCTRTRRPQSDVISSFCLVDGLADWPSLVRGYRRLPCLPLLWGQDGEVLLRLGAWPAAMAAASLALAKRAVQRLPQPLRQTRWVAAMSERQPAEAAVPMQAVKGLGLRALRWIWVCAKPLRAVAPSRRDSDRPRMVPPGRPTARAGAAQSAPPHVVHLAAAEPVQPDGCAAAAAGLDRLRDLRPAPPVPHAVGEAALPAAVAAAENFVALLGSARLAARDVAERAGAAGLLAPVATARNHSMALRVGE